MIFLAIQSTYDVIELGLFNDYQCVQQQSISKFQTSGNLIPVLDMLLQTNSIAYTDLFFCVVSQGPGPFTTLRTVIATMNGLSYATGVPLIGINALELLIQECDPEQRKNMCALLQAFGGDVYVGLRKAGSKITDSLVMPSSIVCDYLKTQNIVTVEVVGNAVSMYENFLKTCDDIAITFHAQIAHGSLQTLAACGLHTWHNGHKGVLSLRPLYFKNHPLR